ncbi:hypothetical protein FPCIR_645 [Fusarium pseudocircinatum]|uniref:Uncharacterized protein n=1 Tax=Fusarium pseudocircinatum TaxID=56676 RepID=A0A8H5PZ77_9HYPO|nr:hypothetical protein FPCIR_645 [Fusarium pseudocircinatum]
MPLLLAPYNAAMRLGMGFNSYTQTMCIDSAVDATDEAMITSETFRPKVTSSTRLFERVSEVVDTMDVSCAATITTSNMEVHGHMNALNNPKIDDADISLMVAVRVMSQITSLEGSARFLPIDGIEAGSPRFNETFGDSYISGFICGGLFMSSISFLGSDPEHKDKMIEAVKKRLTDPTVDLDSICKEVAITFISHGVMIEEVTRATKIESILEMADKFPAVAAQKPERTWAILTKYKANHSFNEWSSYQISKPLDYDGVASYTSKLFDNYIQYNHLSKKVQDMISQRYKHSQVHKPRALPLELNALLAARKLLPKIDFLNANLKDDPVQDIVNEALSESSRHILQQESMVQEDPSLVSVADYTPNESSSGVEELHTLCTSNLGSCSISSRSSAFRDGRILSTDLGMRELVPPEVSADLLPVKNDPAASLISQSAKTAPAPTVKYKELQILAAVCGTHDCTAKLQKLVIPGESGDQLTIPVNEITILDFFWRSDSTPGIKTNLSFVYKYTDAPIRICSFDHVDQSTEVLQITHEYESQNATFVHTSRSNCYILGATYGGKIYSSSEELQPFVVNADHSSPGDWPCIRFNRETIKDEHLGRDGMVGVVFYTYSILNGVQSAVSVGAAGCVLVDQRQLATRAETGKEDTDSLSKKNGKEGSHIRSL